MQWFSHDFKDQGVFQLPIWPCSACQQQPFCMAKRQVSSSRHWRHAHIQPKSHFPPWVSVIGGNLSLKHHATFPYFSLNEGKSKSWFLASMKGHPAARKAVGKAVVGIEHWTVWSAGGAASRLMWEHGMWSITCTEESGEKVEIHCFSLETLVYQGPRLTRVYGTFWQSSVNSKKVQLFCWIKIWYQSGIHDLKLLKTEAINSAS